MVSTAWNSRRGGGSNEWRSSPMEGLTDAASRHGRVGGGLTGWVDRVV